LPLDFFHGFDDDFWTRTVANTPTSHSISFGNAILQALATVLKKHPQVLIITDDIYEHVRWGNDDFVNIIMADNSLKDRSIILKSVDDELVAFFEGDYHGVNNTLVAFKGF
jgi:DNA-binding transcriptional MocR family regulator